MTAENMTPRATMTTRAFTEYLQTQGLEVLHMTCSHVPAYCTTAPDPHGLVKSKRDIQFLEIGKEVTVLEPFIRIGVDAIVSFRPGDRITVQRTGSIHSPSIWTVVRAK